MNIVLIIAKIAIYSFVLVVLYRQSYNFLFFLAKRPKTWIAVVGVIGVINMGLAYVVGWDPRLLSSAALTTFLLNIAPSPSAGHTKEEMRTMVNEIYKEWGLPRGRLQRKIGLAVFGLCSLGSYILFFGEIYSRSGECTPLIRSLLQ